MDEIRKNKEELIRLKNKKKQELHNKYVRNLAEISDEEKIEIFDDFFNDALEMLRYSERGGKVIHDTHYVWKMHMNLLAKNDKFWDYYNSLENNDFD